MKRGEICGEEVKIPCRVLPFFGYHNIINQQPNGFVSIDDLSALILEENPPERGYIHKTVRGKKGEFFFESDKAIIQKYSPVQKAVCPDTCFCHRRSYIGSFDPLPYGGSH